MLKKVVSLLLAAALLVSSMPAALAANVRGGGGLLPYALTQNDGIYREYTDREVVNIILKPGERYISNPFHAIDSYITYFSGVSAISSNPKAVTVSTYDGANGAVGYGNVSDYLSVVMQASETPGEDNTAIVTVEYSTPLNAFGASNYTDRRSQSHFTKTFNVTVLNGGLEMELEFETSNAVHINVSQELKDYRDAFWLEYAKEMGISLVAGVASGAISTAIEQGIIEPKAQAETERIRAKQAQAEKTLKKKMYHPTTQWEKNADMMYRQHLKNKKVLKYSAKCIKAISTVSKVSSVASFGVGLLVGVAVDMAVDAAVSYIEKKIDENYTAQQNSLAQNAMDVVKYPAGEVSSMATSGFAEQALNDYSSNYKYDKNDPNTTYKEYQAEKNRREKLIKDNKVRFATKLFGGLAGGYAVDVAVAFVKNLPMMSSVTPVTMTPEPAMLTVKLTNAAAIPAADVKTTEVTLRGEGLYFSPDRKQSTLTVPADYSIKAGSTEGFVVPVYPAYQYSNGSTSEPVYKGKVTAECSYITAGAQGYAMAQSPELPVYSALTKSDSDFVKRWATMDPFKRSYYVMCPVTVELISPDGEVLFTAENNSEDSAEGAGFVMGSMGEAKYINVGRYAEEGYQLRITATADGMMNILAVDTQDDLQRISVYDQVPLVQGQTFWLDPDSLNPGSLWAEDENGQRTEIASSSEVNEETLHGLLQETDISDWAVEPVAKAMLLGMGSDDMYASFQSDVTVEQFSAMLLNFYERVWDLEEGVLAGNMSGLNVQYPATAAAEGFDFLRDLNVPVQEEPEEEELSEPEMPKRWDGGAAITRMDAAYAAFHCMFNSGIFDVNPHSSYRHFYAWADEEAAAVPEEQRMFFDEMYARGFLPGVQDMIMAPCRVLTQEECLAMFSRMWEAFRLVQERNAEAEYVADHFNEGMLEISPSADNPVGYIIDSENTPVLPLASFGLYSPMGADNSWEYSMHASADEMLKVMQGIAAGENPVPLMSAEALERFEKEETKAFFFDCGWGEMITDSGEILRWIPFCYLNTEGGIADNAVYLYMLRQKPEINADILNAAGLSPESEAHFNQYWNLILADQDEVRALLETQRWSIQAYDSASSTLYCLDLAKDDEGEAVNKLQQELKDRGYYKAKKLTGVFDKNTVSAVKAYQKSQKLTQTGIADAALQRMLFEDVRKLKKNEKGTDVRKVRGQLIALGYMEGTQDGSYDKKAIAAVKAFQEAEGLEKTGVVDELTAQRLGELLDPQTLLLNWMDQK